MCCTSCTKRMQRGNVKKCMDNDNFIDDASGGTSTTCADWIKTESCDNELSKGMQLDGMRTVFDMCCVSCKKMMEKQNTPKCMDMDGLVSDASEGTSMSCDKWIQNPDSCHNELAKGMQFDRLKFVGDVCC